MERFFCLIWSFIFIFGSFNLLAASKNNKKEIVLKPGLWTHSIVVKSESGKIEAGLIKLKKKLDEMPPEKRLKIEKLMAKQGVGLDGQTTSYKVCLTKEQALNFEFPKIPKDDCKQEMGERTGNSFKVKFICTGKPPSTGEGEFTLTSPTTYKGKTLVNTVWEGKDDRLDMNQSGKWESVDCGNILPIKTKN